MNHLKITNEKLSAEHLADLVSSPSCGAISMFIGTTRDNFEGKSVVKLEYEVYESMGIKCIEKICNDMRNSWPSIEHIAIYHRLGQVPVKEASIIIAVSSPHRQDAIKATEWCIDNVKKSVPIWKKEVYADSKPQWKENKEFDYCPKPKIRKLDFKQEVELSQVPSYLVQIKALNAELNDRIMKYMNRKRNEIDLNNVREFCCGDRNSENICARIDAVLQKRKDSKSHLQVNRVLNSYQNRDQKNSNYLTKFIPPNGIEERLQNAECQLSLTTSAPKNVYIRLKLIEDRLLHLESISPEYMQFWDKMSLPFNKSSKKKIFSLEEIDDLIAETEREIKGS